MLFVDFFLVTRYEPMALVVKSPYLVALDFNFPIYSRVSGRFLPFIAYCEFSFLKQNPCFAPKLWELQDKEDV